jgi:hypothetical protein
LASKYSIVTDDRRFVTFLLLLLLLLFGRLAVAA